jgi:uncharacterized cupin superfamily protein
MKTGRPAIALDDTRARLSNLPSEVSNLPVLAGSEIAQEEILYADAVTRVALWKCDPSRMARIKVGQSSTMYIISGRATIHDKDGASREIGPGSVLILPEGWAGEWDIHETIRKLYVHTFPGGITT